MPSEEQIKDLSMIFRAVMILVEDWELDYDLELWAEFCAKVKHLPIPDFGTPSLDELHEVVKWITSEIEDGKAVLVHCLGGMGRSGTVAAAYLISNGFGVDDAIKHVRARVSGAIVTREQEELLRIFRQS